MVPPGQADEDLGVAPDEPVCPATEEVEAEPDFRGIVMTNSFGSEVAETSDGARGGAPPRHPKFCAVYGLPSMLNHSCGGRSDTALKLLLMSEGGAIVFRATRDLEKGEELTHRYFDTCHPVKRRRERSSAWGFECECWRCAFEADRLPRTPAGDAVEAALAAWDKRLRPSMRALSGGSPAEAEVAARRQEVLSELLALVRAVEAAASEQHGWREEEEVAACLALLQTLSDAALWCVVASEKEASGGAGAGDLLALRCQVLGRTVQAWECSDQLDFAHLRTVYMHYKARAQTLQLAPTDLGAARAAEAAARGKCESAFFVRFGISPVNLALGQADCVAEVLLKGLQG